MATDREEPPKKALEQNGGRFVAYFRKVGRRLELLVMALDDPHDVAVHHEGE